MTLGDMRPRLTKYDRSDRPAVDAEVSRQLLFRQFAWGYDVDVLGSAIGYGANKSDVTLGKPSAALGFTADDRLSPLSDLVAHVVELRAEEQMRRVDAESVVACVAGELTDRDVSVEQNPRGAVRDHQVFAKPESAVAARVSARPRPARGWTAALIDVFPEALKIGHDPFYRDCIGCFA